MMTKPNYKQIFAIEKKNKEKWLAINPRLPDTSGIYILTREEDGIKYGYIGQAQHILTRLAQHLTGYQHIDLSLKKHGLYSKDNLTGWKVDYQSQRDATLDQMEKAYIKRYANLGYQLRNKTSGGQGEGKSGIADNKPARGYYDGVAQGKKSLRRELNKIIDKYLVITTKVDNKLAQNALNKFYSLLSEDEE